MSRCILASRPAAQSQGLATVGGHDAPAATSLAGVRSRAVSDPPAQRPGPSAQRPGGSAARRPGGTGPDDQFRSDPDPEAGLDRARHPVDERIERLPADLAEILPDRA